jgi:hypothetical protein
MILEGQLSKIFSTGVTTTDNHNGLALFITKNIIKTHV